MPLTPPNFSNKVQVTETITADCQKLDKVLALCIVLEGEDGQCNSTQLPWPSSKSQHRIPLTVDKAQAAKTASTLWMFLLNLVELHDEPSQEYISDPNVAIKSWFNKAMLGKFVDSELGADNECGEGEVYGEIEVYGERRVESAPRLRHEF